MNYATTVLVLTAMFALGLAAGVLLVWHSGGGDGGQKHYSGFPLQPGPPGAFTCSRNN